MNRLPKVRHYHAVRKSGKVKRGYLTSGAVKSPIGTIGVVNCGMRSCPVFTADGQQVQ